MNQNNIRQLSDQLEDTKEKNIINEDNSKELSFYREENDRTGNFIGSIIYYESFNNNKFNESFLDKSVFGLGQIKSNELEDIESDFKLDFRKSKSKIIQHYGEIHYLCPKCHTFPIILIINNDKIMYICKCKIRKNGIHLSIEKDLDENFLTFSDSNNNELEFEKYTKCNNNNIHPGEQYPFVCYCNICNENLCEECLVLHKNENHNLDAFCFHNSETNKNIHKIYKIINNENIYLNLDHYCKGSLLGEINKINMPGKIIEKEPIKLNEYKNYYEKLNLDINDYENGVNIKNQNLNTLIGIIIKDYYRYPNYNHFKNIENILLFLMNIKLYCFDFGINEENIMNTKQFNNCKDSNKVKCLEIINENFNIKLMLTKKFDVLHTLDLSNNNIKDIQPLVKINFNNLKTLNLSKNKLGDENIIHISNLNLPIINEFDISFNLFTNMNLIKELSKKNNNNFGYISLAGNNFINKYIIKEEINFSFIKSIDLSKNVFKNLNIEILNYFILDNLLNIDLSYNNIKSIDFIKNLKCPKLQCLYLNNNLIEKVKPIENFKLSLKIIQLKNNLISNLEDIKNIINKEKLVSIELEGNKIDIKDKIVNELVKEINMKRLILRL